MSRTGGYEDKHTGYVNDLLSRHVQETEIALKPAHLQYTSRNAGIIYGMVSISLKQTHIVERHTSENKGPQVSYQGEDINTGDEGEVV